MAHNLAFSIKHHNPTVKIGIWISAELSAQLPDKRLFDDIRILPESAYRDKKGKIDPAIAKTQIYRFGQQMAEKFLFLDVDALCMSDIQPLIDDLNGSQIATEVTSSGKVSDSVNRSMWAKNSDIKYLFGLEEHAPICSLQSPWIYFEKSLVADAMQGWLDYFMAKGVPMHKLIIDWGGTLPDELIYQGAFAKLGIIPTAPKSRLKPIFIGWKKVKEPHEQVRANYYLLSLYWKEYLSLHDKLLREYGDRHGFTAKMVMNDKHVNGK